jgi:hypothetical protein
MPAKEPLFVFIPLLSGVVSFDIDHIDPPLARPRSDHELFLRDRELDSLAIAQAPAPGDIPPVQEVREPLMALSSIRLVAMTAGRQRTRRVNKRADRQIANAEISVRFQLLTRRVLRPRRRPSPPASERLAPR